MNRRHVSLMAAFVVASVFGAFAHRATPFGRASAPVPQAGPEHARLTAMAGTWDVDLSFWFQPGNPPFTTKGTSTIRALLGGLFIEEQIEGVLNGTPFTTLAWTGFNTSTHHYEATRIASTNTIRIAETGDYDAATKRFELKAEYPMGADVWHQRTVIEVTSADKMTAASFLSFGGVPEWKGVGDQVQPESKVKRINRGTGEGEPERGVLHPFEPFRSRGAPPPRACRALRARYARSVAVFRSHPPFSIDRPSVPARHPVKEELHLLDVHDGEQFVDLDFNGNSQAMLAWCCTHETRHTKRVQDRPETPAQCECRHGPS